MNIIVTGTSRGIGFELARKFAVLPGNEILAISRNTALLEELQYSTREGKGTLHILPFDLEDLAGIENELNTRVRSLFNSLDVLVNNAGLLISAPVMEMDPGDIIRMMTVNFTAPFILIRSVMPLLERSSMPHVVNIGSMAGVPGGKKFGGLSAYSASKAAVHILTECLAAEYKESTVRFNALALGAVQTEMFEDAFPGSRAPLSAGEMADYIMDFAMNGRKHFNGKILPVAVSVP